MFQTDLRWMLGAALAAALLAGCGESEASPDGGEPARMPITPTYGANAFAYEGIGVSELVASGLSGLGVSVCVVDTGIDPDHPAFAPAFERGAVEWADFTEEASPTPIDTNGHGTHVAGIIAMNGEITGGAPNVHLLIARVFTAEGGTSVAIIAEAVDWCRTEGAHVISMSLGGLTFPAIRALLAQDATASEAAVERALNAGIYVVAAAGNTEIARDVASPAGVAGVIAVGALQQDLVTKALFSQSGINDGGVLVEPRTDPDRKPEVSAPGVGITSAMAAGSTLARDVAGCSDALYCALDGTSQATPFVSAALALLLEARPELRRENLTGNRRDAVTRLKSALADSATGLPGQEEPHDDGVGYGRLDAADWFDAF